ncbi:Cupredoxin [Ephemerocybe angulata]|uniref:Cupredoxin n=1 Tax=Ephemerocybe angulata TaxID=980116 RepID=A0A8H6IG85_9AGAR|nr:Cupredoxin [Tulosesus angulatus]
MFSSAFFSLFALAPVVLGFTIHNVNVGPNTLTYEPPVVHAAPGDVVRFSFNPKNHTVTQSAFDPPCVPLPGGVDTGFVPVAPGTNPLPTRDFVVPDNGGKPLWFYCGQVNHCGRGMVFAINPPNAPNPQSFDAFKALAIARNGTNPAPIAPPFEGSGSGTGGSYGGSYGEGSGAGHTEGSGGCSGERSGGGYAYGSSVAPSEHHIRVGAFGSLEYTPANITALVGDKVIFEFWPKNHTVTQSSFENPCSPLAGGFKSGFKPVAADMQYGPFPTFEVTVKDKEPIWGYCGQVNHCQSGMVFSINADENSPNSFAAFRQLAARNTTAESATSGKNSGAAVLPRVGLASAAILLATFL